MAHTEHRNSFDTYLGPVSLPVKGLAIGVEPMPVVITPFGDLGLDWGERGGYIRGGLFVSPVLGVIGPGNLVVVTIVTPCDGSGDRRMGWKTLGSRIVSRGRLACLRRSTNRCTYGKRMHPLPFYIDLLE